MSTIRSFLESSAYVRAFREEPKLRGYAAAHFVDDVGVAVATWASMLLMTNLFTSQRERAQLMLPTLACFLIGTLVSGPLADRGARGTKESLARRRYRLVVWARLLETLALGALVLRLANGVPTIGTVLPFAMLTAFSKTAFRPAKIAFSVDLLSHETPQMDADGKPLLDERGAPLFQKTHLLVMGSVIGVLGATAVLVGLLLGGRVVAAAHGSFAFLFLIQAVMHLAFCAMVALFCHPTRSAREVRLRDLVVDVAGEGEHVVRYASDAPSNERRVGFFGSLWEGMRFLLGKERRPLLAMLCGTALVELVTESYDGKMIVKQVLHGGDDAVRHAEIVWSIVGILAVAAVPMLARALGSLGKVFLVTMLIDGLVIAFAGHLAGRGGAGMIVPFAAVLAVDHSLTQTSVSLAELAQNSASSAGMRGRIAGLYAFFVIVGDILVEGIATEAAERFGIPGMLVRVGLLQVGIVLLLAIVGGRRLVRFGLHDRREGSREGHPMPVTT